MQNRDTTKASRELASLLERLETQASLGAEALVLEAELASWLESPPEGAAEALQAAFEKGRASRAFLSRPYKSCLETEKLFLAPLLRALAPAFEPAQRQGERADKAAQRRAEKGEPEKRTKATRAPISTKEAKQKAVSLLS